MKVGLPAPATSVARGSRRGRDSGGGARRGGAPRAARHAAGPRGERIQAPAGPFPQTVSTQAGSEARGSGSKGSAPRGEGGERDHCAPGKPAGGRRAAGLRSLQRGVPGAESRRAIKSRENAESARVCDLLRPLAGSLPPCAPDSAFFSSRFLASRSFGSSRLSTRTDTGPLTAVCGLSPSSDAGRSSGATDRNLPAPFTR